MNGFTIEIKSPELVTAIMALAAALQHATEPPQMSSVPQAPVTVTQPVAQPTPAPAPAPAPAPIMPAQTPIITTAPPAYTLEQLATAAAQLMDAGKQGELVQLLAHFGVRGLNLLPPDQYGAFALQLKSLGARI